MFTTSVDLGNDVAPYEWQILSLAREYFTTECADITGRPDASVWERFTDLLEARYYASPLDREATNAATRRVFGAIYSEAFSRWLEFGGEFDPQALNDVDESFREYLAERMRDCELEYIWDMTRKDKSGLLPIYRDDPDLIPLF